MPSNAPFWHITAIVTRKKPPYVARRTFKIQGYSLDHVMGRVHRRPHVQRIIGVVRGGAS